MFESQVSIVRFKELQETERTRGAPVGLNNIGNSCYVNSLLQSYFMIPSLLRKILQYNVGTCSGKGNNKEFMQRLQEMFAMMIGSANRNVDPTSFLSCMLDSQQKKISIGMQQDVGEFNLILIENIQEAFDSELSKLSQSMVLKKSEKKKIAKFFVGECRSVLKFMNTSGEKQRKISLSPFTEIMLNAQESHFYSAWFSNCLSAIPDYIEDNGCKSQAIHETWITTLPYILFFRVNNPKSESSSLFSESICFEYPPVIYPELFLFENRKHIKEAHLKKQKILQEVSAIQEKLAHLSELQISLHVSTLDSLINSADWKEFGDNPEDSNLLDNLKNLTSHLSDQISSLKSQQSRAMDSLDSIYTLPMPRQRPYVLHSIIMHEGQDNRGHFYAYIHDSYTKTWRKYSDSRISIVDQEEVTYMSRGNNHSASAAYIMYIDEHLLRHTSDLPMHVYDSAYPFELVDEYSLYLSEFLIKRINENNKEFKNKKKIEMEKQIVAMIKPQYLDRYSRIQGQVKLCSRKERGVGMEEYGNLAIMLWLRLSEDIAKWYILDTLLVEFCPGITLSTIVNNDALYLHLVSFSKHQPEAPYNLKMKADDIVRFKSQISAFKEAVVDIKLAVMVLDQVIDGDFREAAHGIAYFFQVHRACRPSKVYLEMSEIAKAVVFRILSEIMNFCKAKNKNVRGIAGCLESVKFANSVDQGENFNNFLVVIVKDIGKKFEHCFQVEHEKEEFLSSIEGFTEEFDLDLVGINYQKIEKLKQKVSTEDPYKWREEWETYGYVPEIQGKIKQIRTQTLKFWMDLTENLADLHCDDFETN